jgi:hypothetical protein
MQKWLSCRSFCPDLTYTLLPSNLPPQSHCSVGLQLTEGTQRVISNYADVTSCSVLHKETGVLFSVSLFNDVSNSLYLSLSRAHAHTHTLTRTSASLIKNQL